MPRWTPGREGLMKSLRRRMHSIPLPAARTGVPNGTKSAAIAVLSLRERLRLAERDVYGVVSGRTD
jgi:hypothetical protein